MSLTARIQEDMKTAMRGGDKRRLGVIRLILAAIKQREVDERIVLDDTQVTVVLDKMLKQRRESISQYEQAGRTDLVAQEQFEMESSRPICLSRSARPRSSTLIGKAIAETGAGGIKDMAKSWPCSSRNSKVVPT